MRKLLILLFLGGTIQSHAQCEPTYAWAPSIVKMSHTSIGIGVEMAYFNHESRLGISIGTSLSMIDNIDRFMMKKNGKEIWVTNVIKSPHHTMWIEGLYKLMWKDYHYSLHIVGGGLYDTKRSFSAYGGLNLRIPMGTKALFIQPTYRTDEIFAIRGGMYFEL